MCRQFTEKEIQIIIKYIKKHSLSFTVRAIHLKTIQTVLVFSDGQRPDRPSRLVGKSLNFGLEDLGLSSRFTASRLGELLYLYGGRIDDVYRYLKYRYPLIEHLIH